MLKLGTDAGPVSVVFERTVVMTSPTAFLSANKATICRCCCDDEPGMTIDGPASAMLTLICRVVLLRFWGLDPPKHVTVTSYG
jgi:hypothetical protein